MILGPPNIAAFGVTAPCWSERHAQKELEPSLLSRKKKILLLNVDITNEASFPSDENELLGPFWEESPQQVRRGRERLLGENIKPCSPPAVMKNEYDEYCRI